MAGKALEGGRKKSVDRTGYFFVAPFVIVFFIFNVYPVVRTFYLSFTDYKGFGDAMFTGGTNYLRAGQHRENLERQHRAPTGPGAGAYNRV